MELIERDETLAALARVRDEAFAGRGGLALVGGPVAVGKSALLDRFIGDAAGAGALPLTAIASDAESGLPLGVLAQFVFGSQLPGAHRDRISDLIGEGAERLGGAPAEESARLTAAQAQVADRLCALLVELSAAAPLAVVVDDVHHADPASLACLGYLARRVRDTRIAVVLAHGDSAGHPGSGFLLGVQRQPHCRTLAVAPLTPDGVRRMVATRLGQDEGDGVTPPAAAWHQATGGNPLLVNGLIDDLRAPHAGSRDAELIIGDGFPKAVLAVLRRGGDQMLAAAQGIAVLDGTASLDRLLAADADGTASTVRELTRAGLVADGRFRHPAARSAVLADLDPGLRAALHRRAAELGYADGAPATAVAEHLRAARDASADWAVSTLEEAARQALADGRVNAAIEYLRLACDSCRDEVHRARLRTILVRAEWRINPAAPAQRLSSLLDTMRAGHLAGTDAVVLAKALLWHGRVDDATEVLTLLADSRAVLDPETVTELRATRPWMRCSYAPLLEYIPSADAGFDERAVSATAEVRRRLDASAALDSVLTSGPSERVVEEAERILRATRLEGMGMDSVESALLALTYAEHPRRAATWCDKLIKQALAREAPGRHARLSAIRSEISMRQGDLTSAEEHARLGLEIIPAEAWGVVLGGCLGSLLMALTAMGRHDEAAETLNLPVPETMLQSRFGLHYLQARGRHSLASEDFDGALADFQYCGDLMGRWSMDAPGLIAWRTDAAETFLRMGETDRARTLLEEQLARCDRRVSPRTHGNALRLLAACHELRQRPMLLRHAADVLQESGDSYAVALALYDLTTAFHELGEPRRARVIGRQAWSIANECHADPLCRLLASDSGQPEADTSAAASVLSEAERRVADLVALGLTNREISKRLYITVSTVEQHLTHAYRKLNVSGRADLAMALSVRSDSESAWREAASGAR
jgi:DNA-binding CsgD family transcriptional regulator